MLPNEDKESLYEVDTKASGYFSRAEVCYTLYEYYSIQYITLRDSWEMSD